MNVKRFTGRNSREAMQKVKQAFGDDAVVLSTKPAPEGGIEILAMAGDSVPAIESYAKEPEVAVEPALSRETASRLRDKLGRDEPEMDGRKEPSAGRTGASGLVASVQDDVKQLAMSTLSFQDYVRERMLKRRQAALKTRTEPALEGTPEQQLSQRLGSVNPRPAPVSAPAAHVDLAEAPRAAQVLPMRAEPPVVREAVQAAPKAVAARQPARAVVADMDLSMAAVTPSRAPASERVDAATAQALKAAQDANASMLEELRAMRAMMKERFETIAFIEKLGRTPAQASLAQKLLDGGFSPVLIRKMLDAMPADVSNGAQDEHNWGAQVLQRNLNTADNEAAIEDQGGVFALIGSTGVGKTTTTAKLAAMFAAKHGAQNLGLITLDAYRVGAHDQLRAYGRILGVPVHMAHDRAALEDLLELLSGKKLVLIDTAGMAQRDGRTKELLDMLAHRSIRKVLVVNASSQGDAIEDVMTAYQAHACAGVILSKLDEAVKLGPALDALIRHKLKVLGVANGQRVPEDWHRLSAQALVHRALRASLNPAYRLDPNEVSLVFSTPSAGETVMRSAAM
ncbi:flagellar biosynthesis protein FlhF [Aquabacterium sp.]|uniref:flagellar biosynthesis protein FlhF n=1 Tax=Aquabacterium sp. TaxID=1872578 RepID=UPI0035AFF7D5